MKKSTQRGIGIGVGLLILVAGFGLSSYLVNSKEEPPKRQRTTAVREVAVRTVTPSSAEVDIELQGRLVAFQRVPIIAEVTGVFDESARPFKQGIFYREGDILARIDDTEARYQLLASKSTLANSLAQAMPELKIDYPSTFPTWDAYLRDFDPERPLPPLPEAKDDAARFFLNARNIYSQYYNIKATEERLTKYTLRAPFSGTLTEATATVGALVRSGQPLGTLTASSYELAATVPVADLAYLTRGTKAELQGPNGQTFTGTVNRVSTQIDPNTQTATVFLNVRGGDLREGLYLKGTAQGSNLEEIVAVDQRYLVGTDELYVLPDSTLQRAPVEVIRRSASTVYVRGLSPGARILDEPVPGAYVGMKVRAREADPSTSRISGTGVSTGL